YLPTRVDLSVSTKIAGNEFLRERLSHHTFTEKLPESEAEHHVNDEWIEKLYSVLVKTAEAQEYIAETSRQPKAEKAIIRFIWEKVLLAHEGLMEYFSEELPGWEDDHEMTLMLMENFFKTGSKVNFLSLVSGEKREYAQSLMQTVLEKKAYCM